MVTGGSGFIGSATVRLLASEGFEVVSVDVRKASCPPRCRLVLADVRRLDELARLLGGYKGACIIHLAAIVSVEEVNEKPREAVEVNVGGTHTVLELARKLDSPKLVLASSVAVYGEPKSLPIGEDHPLNPANLYGATKVAAELLARQYWELYGVSYVALRYFNVYGPGMKPGRYASVVYRFVEALLTGRRPVIYGDGRQTRDFVYVDDVARANLLALSTSFVGPINIGSGVEVSVRQLLETLMKVSGVRAEPVYAPPRPGDVRRSRARIELARVVLGWRPITSLEEGLRKTVEHYRRVFGGKA